MPSPISTRQFGNIMRWLPAKNVGTVDISAYGCVEVTGIADDALTLDKVWTVKRPTSASPAAVAVNGPSKILAAAGADPAGYGLITFDEPFMVLYTGSSPSVGATLGPMTNVFTVDTNGTTFIAMSASLSTPTRVLAKWNSTPGQRPYFGRTTTAITGATGTTTRTLGSGSVDLFTHSGTSGTNTTTSVTAYNCMASEVPDDTYVQLAQFAPNGNWFVTAVDCE